MLLFGHERHAASSEGKAAAKIDVVDLPVGSVLNKTTVEAVDRDAALLVGTDDRAASTPARCTQMATSSAASRAWGTGVVSVFALTDPNAASPAEGVAHAARATARTM